MPNTRMLLRVTAIATACLLEPSERAVSAAQRNSGMALTEQRLEAYAACHERLDPLAIRAILSAHERIGSRPKAQSLPVYGDNLVEWLFEQPMDVGGTSRLDPSREAASGPQSDPTVLQLEAEAARCGLGSAAAYWETTRRIVAVLDYRRVGRATAIVADASEAALLERFFDRLGLCEGSGKTGRMAGGTLVCWNGMSIVGAPCPPDMNFGSTGYYSRDGVCYPPGVGRRPDGRRLRTVCSQPGEIRRDVPAYPVLCEEGTWQHVLPCSQDADCRGQSALPRSCKRGVCYARHPDRERPVGW
jgi:hypothetical protein